MSSHVDDFKAETAHNETTGSDYDSPSEKGVAGTAAHGYDKKWERRTITKIDVRLLIILGLCYAVSLIDRTNISVARVAGMEKDLKLNIGDRYSIISLVFFVPYIIFELPSNIVLQKVGARYWLSAIVMGFGVIMLGMGFVKTWQQLAALRTVLGLFEAGFFPACTFLISTWYTRYETQSRMAVFYLTSMVISGFSNIIGYGISLLGGTHGLEAWRWIFIVFGAATMGLAIISFFLIVDFPSKSTFLTPEQKQFVIQRVEADRGDALPDKLTLASFGKAISDWKIFAYALLFMSATTPSYAFAFFLPVILGGMGYDRKTSLLLSAPPYVVAAVYTFIMAVASDKTRKRAPFIGTSAIVCLVGLMITAYTKSNGVRYFGCFLTIAGAQSNVPAVITYAQNNVRKHSKRSVTSALVIGFGGIGGIVASTVYRQKDYPRYVPGLWTTVGLQLLILALLGALSLTFAKNNKAVDAGEHVNEDQPGFKYTI